MTGRTNSHLINSVESDVSQIGKGATTSYERGIPTFQTCMLPEKFEITLPYVTKFNLMFGNSSSYTNSAWGAKEIIIHGSQQPIITSLANMFGRTSESSGYWGMGLPLEKIVLDFNMAGVTTYEGFLRDNRNKLKEIVGNFDFTSVSSASGLSNMLSNNMSSLTYLRFVANTLSYSLSIANAPALDTQSLISIINGLNESATGQTLTLHATPKASLSSIMGNVLLDETETYHIFTADEQGTITLLDFATNIKGWTVA